MYTKERQGERLLTQAISHFVNPLSLYRSFISLRRSDFTL
jgi:hypothetical protein